MADIWDVAVEEARASASGEQFEVETIELIHPVITDKEGLPDSIRLVLDEREWPLQLEAGAPLHGGQTVLFTPCAMRVTVPEQVEGKVGEVRLAFDAVPRTIHPWLDKALTIRADGRLIVRVWLANRNSLTGEYTAVGGPREVLRGLAVREVMATATAIEMTASFKDLVRVGFPRRLFTQQEFPGLF